MAKLCDPDIDMITMDGCDTPEPSIRSMIEGYYRQAFTAEKSRELAADYINEQDKICKHSISH